MKGTILSPRCKHTIRSEYRRKKCFTSKKVIGKLFKCESLKTLIEINSKSKRISMSQKSFTVLKISPLLNENEKKFVKHEKCVLGYWPYNQEDNESVLENNIEYSDSSSSSDEDEEYIFTGNNFS